MRNKILITGSTGFVGQNLIEYLNQCELDLLKRDELITCSLDRLMGKDSIIHLAGKAHDVKKASNPDEYYHVNYELTKSLYDAFLKSDVKKFLFISSVKAVADSVEDVLTESTLPNPKTDYGKSKLMAENYIRNQPLPAGKSYYILRPCMIHGPGNKGNLNLLYKFVEKGIPYPLAAFQNKRSFLSIKNMCFIINKILYQDIPSGVYNLADDELLSTNQVVHILSSATLQKVAFLRISPNILSLLAKVGDIIKLPFNTERLNKLTENYRVDNTKIKQAIKCSLPQTATDGLLKTANSFKKI